MTKVTEIYNAEGERVVFICDFSPPRRIDDTYLDNAKQLDADFICVAYNPGKSVRVDSAMLAYAIKERAGKETIFNLATRDMNKLAIQTHLLGAQVLGVENVIIVQGDRFTERDLALAKEVSDYRPTELIGAVAALNEGTDYKGQQLRTPTSYCIGASIDLARGVEREARLTHRKALAGAHFFIAQPIFDTREITRFQEAYQEVAGQPLTQPVFYGLQILEKDGVIFSSVPQGVRDEIESGRSGTDIALEHLEAFLNAGIRTIYLVAPILRGGVRNYAAAQHVIEEARRGGH